MASSGSFNTGGYSGRYLRFEWSVKSQSVAANSTVIHYVLKGAGGSTTSWYQSGNFKLVIDGRTVYSSSTRIRLYNGTVVAEGDFTLNHTSDGTRSFNAYAEAGIYTVAVNCSGSGSWSLPTIARGAVISSAPNFNDNQSPTVNYTNPAGTAVSSVQIAIVNPSNVNTVYCAYRDISKTGTSYTFAFTQAELQTFYTATANSKTLAVRFRIKTVIGGTTLYSDADRTLTMVDCYPVFNASYIDTNATTVAATGDNQLIVQKLSTLRISVTNAATFKSATVKTASCTVLNKTYTANISNGAATLNIGTVDSSQDLSVPVIVTDSRGYTATINLTVRILAWTPPTADITLVRQYNFYTETSITVDATYADEIKNNTLTIRARYKKTSEDTYSAPMVLDDNVEQIIDLDNEYSWDVQVAVYDNFGSSTYNRVVGRGVPLMYRDIKRQSVGFGGFPQYDESVEVSGRLFVQNQDILDKFSGIGGTAQAALTSDWNTAGGMKTGIYMGSNMSNAPGGSANWFFVLHMVHNDKYQRQVAFDFFSINIWTRRMDNGTWGNWEQVH